MKFEERYSRQILFAGLGGREGQERLRDSSIVIIGCGALGAIQAEILARAGVGRLILVDRDFVEESNLHRQLMFEENDALERLPKAIAAARRINRVNSDVKVEPIVEDLTFENVESILSLGTLTIDGTDNFETRFLINEASVKLGVPWIYGAAVGSYGLTMTVIPEETPCLNCVLDSLPSPGNAPTCDTAGVIMPIVTLIGSIQAAEAMKILLDKREELHGSLLRFDLWDFRMDRINIQNLAEDRSGCLVCGQREFNLLRGAGRQVTTTLCGRNAVQISRSIRTGDVDLNALASRLKPLGQVAFNDFLLRFQVDNYDITVFRDARSIIRGTSDPATARGLYARYIGL